jgi:hypothetical protein
LAIVALQFIYSYGVRDAEISAEFEKANTRFEALSTKIQVLTDDRIHRATVEQMFENRDIRINNLSQDLLEIKQAQKEGNRLLTEIYKGLNSPGTN